MAKSPRARGPCIALIMSGIPKALLELELFAQERGLRRGPCATDQQLQAAANQQALRNWVTAQLATDCEVIA